MGGLLVLFAFVASALCAALFLLITFFLLPWARGRMGGWALTLIPLSTFAGAFSGWTVLWLFIRVMEV